MDRGLDSQMQRILKNGAGYTGQNNETRIFDYAPGPVDHPQADWNYAPASRQTVQEPVPFSPYNRPGPPYQQPNQSISRPSAGTNRLSLAPRNAFTQPQNETRVLSNADNHFRFTQNLHEGVPLNQPPAPRQNSIQPRDTINHLAKAMLTQNSAIVPRPLQSMPQMRALKPESINFFGSHANSKLSQLQPQKLQITPPFNLVGFAHSPRTRQSATSSSPLAGQASSPTARVSLRRAATRAAPPATYETNSAATRREDDVFSGDGIPMPEAPARQAPRSVEKRFYRRPSPLPSTHTPQQKVAQPTRHTPSLALGHAPPMAHGIQLVSPYDLPDRFRHVFPYDLFNAAQSKCFGPVYKTNENIVVSAPTGSGKTAILELAICKVVERYHPDTFKIVCLAPIKSLCSERLRDWTKKFSHLNLPCAELTGDTNQIEMNKARSASIIITTPEKWDSITRKWADHAKLVQMVRLFLIDEVHILKDPRGATLEAIVSRMKKMSADVRFVALSATIPNSQDVATWLGKDHTSQHLPAHRETFGEDFRPVRLQRHVHGFEGIMNYFAFEKVLNGKLPSLIQKYTQNKPILVFCYTRKSCEQTAVLLAEWWSRQRDQDRAWPVPKQRVNVSSRDLRDLLDCGIAFHHAGLDVQDRHAVEMGFLGGSISVICCTSTLAVGVNLPCHLVVLKGSVGYQDGKLCEYSDLEVMQMLGRAGRPQFDDSAVAVIMTRADKVERYKKMISGQDTLESTLHLNCIELLNSEISLGTVKNVHEAKVWLNGTFLSVRMRQNPKYYDLVGVAAEGNTDQRLEQACERDIKLLQKYNLISNKDQFTCTEYGEAMSRYMVKFETMKLLLSIPPQAKTAQILEVVCKAVEFNDLKIKPNERPILREFNKSPFIKYQIKEAVTTTAHKVSLMIQVQLGGIEHPNEKSFNVVKRQFMLDKSVIFERVQRLMRCVIDCKAVDEDAIATRHALDLARSLSAEFWEYSNLQLRQLQGVGPAAVRKMVSNNVNSIEKLDEKDAAGIERIMSKNPPYGKKMKDDLAKFPRLELRSEIVGKFPFKQGKKPKVNIRAILTYKGTQTPVWHNKKPSLIFVAETSGGRLVHFWRGNISKLDKGFELRFNVEFLSVDEHIRCLVACEEIVGTIKSSTLKHDIPASQFLPPSTRTEPQAPRSSNDSPKKLTGDDEFGDDEFSDGDMVAVIKSVEKDVTSCFSDGFAYIDDLETVVIQPKLAKEEEKPEAARISNGKYACQHACRDGQLLKNGKTCKHKCCSEGLNKPPARKRKSPDSNDGPDNGSDKLQKGNTSFGPHPNHSKKQKVSDRGSVTKFKSDKESNTELDDVEYINLAEEVGPVPYESLARDSPHEYRKLHALHTSILKDKDKSIRLPKQKAGLSHAIRSRPELRFFQKKESTKDELEFNDLSDDDFPTTAQLAGLSQEVSKSDDYENSTSAQKSMQQTASTYGDDLIQRVEAGMVDLEEPTILQTPQFRKSFSEGLFDFNTFEDVADGHREKSSREKIASSSSGEPTKETPSSELVEEEHPRATSLEADIEEVKHRRTTQAEQAQAQQVDSAGNLLPEWVNEFDSKLIDSLKDFVDFVD